MTRLQNQRMPMLVTRCQYHKTFFLAYMQCKIKLQFSLYLGFLFSSMLVVKA